MAVESSQQHAQGTAKIHVVPRPDGTIHVPAYVRVGARGLKAEIPFQQGNTYQWSISGGRLLPPLDAPVVSFDAGMTKHVILNCRVSNVAGDVLNSSIDIETSPEPVVSIRPDHVVISTGETTKFGFDLAGRIDTPLLWRVNDEGGGTIDQSGNYKAPNTPGVYRVEVLIPPGVHRSEAAVKVVERPEGRIELSGNLIAGARNLEACVPVQVGMNYTWKVLGGSLVEGQNVSCIKFSVGPGPTLTLVCVISNEAGASLELSRTLPVRRSGN